MFDFSFQIKDTFQILHGRPDCLFDERNGEAIECQITKYKTVKNFGYVISEKYYILLNLENYTYKMESSLNAFEEKHQKVFRKLED